MSTACPRPVMSSAKACTAPGSAKSTAWASKLRPSAVTARSMSLPELSSDALTPMMSAPAAANAVAIANPIPRLAPVTTATLPVRSKLARDVNATSFVSTGVGAIYGLRTRPSVNQSIEVPRLGHRGPLLAVRSTRQAFLQRIGQLPPALGGRVGSDAGLIGIEVVADIFEVAKQQVVVNKDGEVAEVGAGQHVFNFRPHV